MLTQSQIKELKNFLNQDHKNLNDVIHNSGLDKDNDFESFEFDGLYMKDVDFSGFNLENASFNRSLLTSVDFKESNLKNTRFSRSNIRKCQFKGAHHINSLTMELVHLFRNYNLEKEPDTIWEDFGGGVGKVLFVEDEEQSIKQNIVELKSQFPGLECDIINNESEARSKIHSEEYLIAVIDAKIPEVSAFDSDFNRSEKLRGAEIAKDLSNGNLISANSSMLHVVLTHYAAALKNENLDGTPNFLGTIQKDKSEIAFENTVIRTVFFQFLNIFSGSDKSKWSQSKPT